MSYRSHNQRDANQPEIVEALRERGAVVVEIEHPTDLLVGYRGFWTPCEVKSSQKAKIQPSQKAFAEHCQAHNLGVIFLMSLADVDYWFPTSENPCGNQPAAGSRAQPREDNNPVGR